MSTIYQIDKVMKRQDDPISQNQSNLVPEYQDVPIITNNYRYQQVQSDLSQKLEEEVQGDAKPFELKVEKVQTQFKLALPAPQPDEEIGLRAQSRQGRHGKILIKREEDEAFHAQQQLNIKRTNPQIRIFNLDEDENQQSIIQNLNDSSVSKPMEATPIQISVSRPNQAKEAEEGHNSFLDMEQHPTGQVVQPLFERQIQQLVVQPSRIKEEVNYYSGKTEDSLPKKQRKAFQLPNAKGTIKKGLFFQPSDEVQYEMAKVDSRQSLEAGILTTSRDENSSRLILQPLSPQKIKKKSRSLKPLAKTLQRKAETLYQLKKFQKIEKLQQQHKRMKVLSNGKFEIVKQDIIDVFGFVCRSIPYDKCVETAITRNRGWRKLGNLDYDLATNDGQYLLSAKKMPCHLGSIYNLSLAKNSFADSSEYLVGQVQGNFVGTIFNVYTVQQIDINTQELDATIHYSASCISCQAKTREVQIYMKNRSFRYVELEGADEDKKKNLKELYEFQNNRTFKKIYKFISKPAKWNPEKEIYTLNLRKKAKYLSVKNMIIVNAEDHSQEGLLLAKKGENQFQFDISYPFTPIIALGVAMSSFDFKLASQ